jgi:protein-disulfide isomerase
MAQAVYCAEKESKGWAAHKWIFDGFGSPNNTNFKKLKSDLKLSEEFESCMNSDEAMRAIENQSLAGQKAKVDGTPAVFVNEKRLPAGHYLPVLEALYKQLKSNELK